MKRALLCLLVAAPLFGQLAFYPVTPCRIADTRSSTTPAFTGSFGPPALAAGSTRSFPILASSCKIPSTAQAYSLNVTAVPSGALGYLTIWPTGSAQPQTSTLNASSGLATANAAIVPAGTSGAVSVFASGATNLVIDIDGYFVPSVQGPQGPPGLTGPAGPPALGFGTVNGGVNTSVILSVQMAAHGIENLCIASGGVTAFTCKLPIAALQDGYGPNSWFVFSADVPCQGIESPTACTLNIDGNGAIAIWQPAGSTAATFNAGAHIVFYDGKVFRLLV